MSDEEIAEEIIRCNDAYEAGGWTLIRTEEGWCNPRDWQCQQDNYRRTLASLADSLTHSDYTLRDYQHRGEERWGWADGAVVIATRLTGNERYEWEQYLGLPPGASLIRATLPDGRVGGVASTVSDSSVSVAPPASHGPHSLTPVETAQVATAIGGYFVTSMEFAAMAEGNARLLRGLARANVYIGTLHTIAAWQAGSRAQAVVSGTLTAGMGVALFLGSPYWITRPAKWPPVGSSRRSRSPRKARKRGTCPMWLKQAYIELARQCVALRMRRAGWSETATKDVAVVLAGLTLVNVLAVLLLVDFSLPQERPLLYVLAILVGIPIEWLHRALLRRWVVDESWELRRPYVGSSSRGPLVPWIALAVSFGFLTAAGLWVGR